MRRAWLTGLAAIVGLGLLGATPGFGEDKAKETGAKDAKATKVTKPESRTALKPVAPAKADAKAAAPKTVAAKPAAPAAFVPKAHLPAGLGKLNLTQAQHDQALAITRKYVMEIRFMQGRIKSLQTERDTEINKLLTPDQRKGYADAKAAMEAKRAANMKKAQAGLQNAAASAAGAKAATASNEKEAASAAEKSKEEVKPADSKSTDKSAPVKKTRKRRQRKSNT
jgi:hypothetical protein